GVACGESCVYLPCFTVGCTCTSSQCFKN
uniref:Cyclotide ltri-A n=1 Tax=Leonia triandra TaxID=1977830 RepID=CYLRA_LEOTR|nr:RecName: Full=Cyclotide ltri-A [Leonia triandra]